MKPFRLVKEKLFLKLSKNVNKFHKKEIGEILGLQLKDLEDLRQIFTIT